jgi:response regulator RpfG family c-di-GMP phosphodiesterase
MKRRQIDIEFWTKSASTCTHDYRSVMTLVIETERRIMNDRILCVDDEPMILSLYQHQFPQFDVCIAAGGEQGLRAIQENGPFAVIVSDLHMPSMNGTKFLARAREITPNSIRMLLTGQADLHAAIDAVNEGHIFRFLTKPCPRDKLLTALQAGIEQYRLVTAEKELLERTLRGSIEVLTEVLSIVSPAAFGRTSRIRRLVQQLGSVLQVANPWLLEVAAMLSQIGCVSVPDSILTKIYSGAVLPPGESEVLEQHPKVGRDLIRKIPRLEEVSEIIAHQNRPFEGKSQSTDGDSDVQVPLGSRILKVALDCEELESRGVCRRNALEQLLERKGCYDPQVITALQQIPDDDDRFSTSVLPIRELRPDMILSEDLLNNAGVLLIRKGQEISGAMLYRLLNHSVNGTIREPVRVRVPARLAAS